MGAAFVQIIDDAAALAELEPHWRALWRRCPQATPFQSPAWLLPWWTAFAPGTLATLAVWDGADLVALVPLYREETDEGPRLLPVGIGISDSLGVLADPGRARETLPLVTAALGEGGLPVLWTDVPPGDPAEALEAPAGWRVETGAGTPCPVIALAGAKRCDDGLPDAVPAGKRRKVRMSGHRAERRGGVETRSLADLGADAFLDVLEDLHTRRWRERGESGVLQDPRVRAFHRMALPRLVAEGLADAEVLEIEGRPAAAYYGLRGPAARYAYLGGIHPDFERESPGTLVMARAIARAADGGAAAFNLLRGQEAYKYDWGAADTPLGWRKLTPPG